ncbi:hypothetical protein ACFLQV_03820, partial [Calditrichota bacterium]
SDRYTELGGRSYIMGAKAIDDDGDWTVDDDLDMNGAPSANWDGGGGFIGRDDDGDGMIDEELADGLDDDGDGQVDEDTEDGDDNGDTNCGYDPEPHMDEDPAGDISADYIDNDFDGLVDDMDSDFDGDAVPGSLDDDGDGLEDEDGVARGAQEFYCVYDDTDPSQVQNADSDGHTPLNIQVLQRTYSWGEQYRGEFILIDLIIRNIGQVPLTDVYMGLFADADVAAKGEAGDPASMDDWNFYDSANLMMIQGDDSTDADGFGPGLYAMKVVRTPAPLSELNIAFQNFNRGSGGDPELNVDKYDMLSARSTNNSPPTAVLEDWRYLMGFGPSSGGWLLLPGDELPVTVACIAGRDIADIQRNAQWAQAIYDNDFQGPSAPDQPDFWTETQPNKVRIYWRDNAEASIDPITKEQDFEGYFIQRSSDSNKWNTIKAYDLIDEIPNPVFEREDLDAGMPYDENPNPGINWRWELNDAGTDTIGRLYWYDDPDVIRGWSYYYVVRSFDQGVEGAGILITPIGRAYKEAIVGYTPDTPGATPTLEDIWVVPNPYKGGNRAEYDGAQNESGVKYYPRKIWFMNLPTKAGTVDIYTLAGDHVVQLIHDGATDQLLWDMRNKYHQEILSGIYYFVVEIDGLGMKIDKFVVMK